MAIIRTIRPLQSQTLSTKASGQKDKMGVKTKKPAMRSLSNIQRRIAEVKRKTHASILAVKKGESLEAFANRLWNFAHPKGLGVNRVLNMIGAYDQLILMPKETSSLTEMIEQAQKQAADFEKKKLKSPSREPAGRR